MEHKYIDTLIKNNKSLNNIRIGQYKKKLKDN